jgi:sugar lactone lactonase YvrE
MSRPRLAFALASGLLVAAPAFAHDWNGLVADQAGRVFAIDAEDGFVWKITFEGADVIHAGKPAVAPFLDAKTGETLIHPHHLEIDGDDRLWLASGCDKGLIWRISPDGKIDAIEWPKPEGFTLETVLPDGPDALWIVAPKQVLRLTLEAGKGGVPRGTKLDFVAAVGSPSGTVARAPDGALLVGDGDAVKRVAKDGRVSVVVEGVGGEIFGLAVGKDGALTLTDWERGRLLRFEDGALRELAHGLAHPSGIVLAPDGSVLVKESGRQTHTIGEVKRVAVDGTVTRVAKLERPAEH